MAYRGLWFAVCQMSGEFSRLMNIGPATDRLLPEVGIDTIDELRRVGSVEAYLRLKTRFGRRISLNMLYALEGALTGTHWRDFDHEFKRRLREDALPAESSRPPE